jgi:rhodanese-related sulfurtransferase
MEQTRVTVDELRERLDRGEQFTFVDARNSKAWDESEIKLPGAIRVPANEAQNLVERMPRDRTVITYCT